MIAAAGNDGEKGAFYISTPGSGLSNIAVASIDNIYNLQQSAVTEEGSEYRKYINTFCYIRGFFFLIFFFF